jgi:hypothetical protein
MVDGADLMAEHGVLLQAARGPIPNLPELVVGAPVAGSWWAHPAHDEILRVLNEAMASGQVVRLRLVGGKVTLVHRRLWPALVRLASRLGAARLAAVGQEHTAGGRHRSTTTPFPNWVPDEVAREAAGLTEEDALAQVPACLRTGCVTARR